MLDVVFLGTCACDFSKRLETDLKDVFDKDVRRSSSILIDREILVDCGPHTIDSLRIAGIRHDSISSVVITHIHDDHFNIDNILTIAKSKSTPLKLYVREDADVDISCDVEIVRMKPFAQYCLNNGITVTGMDANHDASAYPQHLLFKKNGKSIFYGCDGAWLLNTTYYALQNAKLDMMVLDCTTGDYEGDYRMGEHNSIPMLRVMLPSLRTFSVITDNTKVYFSHLAPSLHASHSETEKIAVEMGAHVAYDGLEIQV